MNLKILADNRGLKAPNVGVDFKALKEQGYHPSPPSIPVSNSSVERNFTPSIVESFQTASKSRYGVELQQGHQSNFNSVGHNDLEQTLRAISDREESTASRHSLTVMTDNTDIYGAAAGQVSIPGDREQTTNSESKQLSLGTLLRDEMVNQILNQPASFFRLSNFTKSLGNYLLQVAREEDISKDKEIFAEQLLAMKPFHAQLVLDSFPPASQAILRDEMVKQLNQPASFFRLSNFTKSLGNYLLQVAREEDISKDKESFAKQLLAMKPFHAQLVLDSFPPASQALLRDEMVNQILNQPASFFRLSNFTKSLGNYLLQVAREEDISKDKEIFAEQLLAMKPFHAQLVLDSFSTASQAILRDEMRTQIINQRSIVPAILRGQDGLKEMGLNLALRIPGATSAAESISRKKDVFAKLLLEMKPFHAQVILDSLAQHTTIEVHTEVYTNVGGQSNPPLASEGK